MPLINCEINLMLYWSENCFLSSNAATNQAATFAITDTKLYVPVLTLSTQDNAKLLQQLKSEFKRIIIWSKYQSRLSSQTQNQYLDYLIDPSFQGAKRLFVLSFENKTMLTEEVKKIFSSKCRVKDYDWWNFFWSTNKKRWKNV